MTENPARTMDFVSFHTHFDTSYGDGFGPAMDHAKRAHFLGMNALGLSDHGNTNGHVAHEIACKEVGLHAIFGCEIYLANVTESRRTQAKTHLTIFAMNDEGYHNLNKIVTQSYIDAYYWPTVSWKTLEKYSAGIVVLSGCADSLTSCTLLGGKFLGDRRDPNDEKSKHSKGLRRVVQRFQDVFEDRYFLELQRFPQLDRTCAVNGELVQVAQDTGIPVIATADVHYPLPYQNVMQAALHSAHRSGTVATTDAEWEYGILLTYPESDHEIHSDLIASGVPYDIAQAAIENTQTLSQRCQVELPKAKPIRYPGVKVDTAMLCGPKAPSQADLDIVRREAARLYIMNEIKKGWKYRVEQRPEIKSRAKEYSRRVSYELDTIVDKDFIDYFLVTGDLVRYVKDLGKGIGPARGSAAGSLVCYLLRITEIDPLYPVFNKMIFERFLDKTRSDPPDIDLDFDLEARVAIVDRAVEIYSRDNVANVGNHMKRRGVSALNAMAKAHYLSNKVFDPIKDRIQDRSETDERVNDTILDVIESYGDNEEIAALVKSYWKRTDYKVVGRTQSLDDDGEPMFHEESGEPVMENVLEPVQVPGPIELATWLEGNRNGLGIHAAGFVISSEPITDTCAILSKESGQGRKRKRVTVIPYDKRDAEYLNLLKFDFLGLNTIGVIRRAAEIVGMTMNDIYKLYPPEGDLRDTDWSRPIIERFRADDLVGIFQFEGTTTRSVLRGVDPTEFRHLADINALSRPGPKHGGQTARYIEVKSGEEELELIHPIYDNHVEWTYGQIVYQEQIMFILRDLAGFPIEKVLKVRKIIGKKLGEHQFKTHAQDFIDGCATNGVKEDIAARIWASITTAAGYAFNTSHSYSYSWIAWLAMWLKENHPGALYASSLWANGDGKDELPRRTALIQDMIAHNIAMLPLDPDASGASWDIDMPDHEDAANWAVRPGFSQIPGIGEAMADDIVTWRRKFDPTGDKIITWEDLAKVKGIGVATVKKIKDFAGQPDPFGVHRVSKQLGAFRDELERGDYDGIDGFPDESEFRMSGSLEDDDHFAWVGFVKKKDLRDEVEGIYKKTGKSIEEIRESLSDPHLTKKVVMFGYDEEGEIALRINRWRLPDLQAKVDGIKEDWHVVVAWGKVYEASARSIQVKSLWLLTPDDE